MASSNIRFPRRTRFRREHSHRTDRRKDGTAPRVCGPRLGTRSWVDDIEAIRQLKARYFRFMDTKDWEAMREVFTDDVVMDTTASGGNVMTGADQYMVYLRETIGDAITVHHGHTPEIELTSPTTATGVWAMEDVLRWPNGRELHGYGHYYETYEKVDGAWRIKTLMLTRLRMDFTEPAGG
jgi:uncharacterized protein (TIGR02246 family)